MANTQVSEGVYNTNESMFIGEFLCCIPLVWQYARSSQQGTVFSRIARIWEPRPAGYAPVGEEEEDETLCGWRMCWMWFPALFDSELREEPADLVCGTTLMNVGLILTPVSIYQMSRGALVLWVGVLSVIFLRRKLWLYQWSALLVVTLGVCLVGLSGSLVQNEGVTDQLVRIARSDDDPAKVALGVALILFAQIFTATQYVS
jgi:hypothetical protein